MPGIELPVGAWYGDQVLSLPAPDQWRISVHRPRLPSPLTESEIAAALEHPVGQPPIRVLARGRKRPLIIVDDLSRPTPADAVLPHVLRQLAEGGIAAPSVTILVGGGTHRPQTPDQLRRKLGAAATSGCRVLAHDCTRDTVRIGSTRTGVPIHVNRAVAESDLLIGIGGVYPQHSVGFGGGAKQLLGVLGKRSIVHLHYGHGSVAGSYDVDNDFRRELEEMAMIVGLRTCISLHVDDRRRVVRAVSGDHLAYFPEAARFSRNAYAVPAPDGADIVISDAYPMDTSLTFARSKGMAPAFRAGAGASRVVVAACSEGSGYHGLFPVTNRPRFERQLHIARRLSVVRPRQIPAKLAHRARRFFADREAHAAISKPAIEPAASAPKWAGPIWLYASGRAAGSLPSLAGMRTVYDWSDVVEAVGREQSSDRPLDVAVYPCASILCVEPGGRAAIDHLAGQLASA